MKGTRYVPFGLQALRPGPRLADGESRFIIAGGGMTSTLDDFAAFDRMHLNGAPTAAVASSPSRPSPSCGPARAAST